MALCTTSYEQGPIRPPSEAKSLLLRLTRNCPWNRCLFCPIYKNEKFSLRSPEEVKNDLEAMAHAADRVKELSVQQGYGGKVNRRLLALIQSDYPDLLPVSFWLYHGGKTVFLQDADSLNLPVAQLADIINLLKEKFPSVSRITTYARSRTVLRRSVDELIALKKAGLNRIHVGMESGNDLVLDYMQKGVTGSQHVEAGLKVKDAGISVSEYIILGLGGTKLWYEHALDSARVLNSINPDFIRVRTLAVHPASPLFEKVSKGEFKLRQDDDIVREEALLIDHLEGIESWFYSDHILNLLEDVNGKLPQDKAAMKKRINNYLAMPEKRRQLFRLGRRCGYFRTVDDMHNKPLLAAVDNLYEQLQKQDYSVDQYIEQLMLRFI